MGYMDEYKKWMDSPALSECEWSELNSIADNDEEIRERFYAPLEFGTAGLRGTMKTGLHNMNIHIIRHATQAFADVISSEGEEAKNKGIVIAHDCRNNSRVFAEEAAAVMAANGITVKLFESLRPTPELSFAIIHFKAAAGLNITASHNPKEYNGYKVYWCDGAQLPPEKADAIAARMRQLDVLYGYQSCDFTEAVETGAIEIIGNEVDELFLQCVLNQAINKQAVLNSADDLNIVYTPFHGCGYKMVPEALKRLGIKHLYPVPEQMIVDGNFPTVASPNPENPEGFYLAVDLAKKTGSNLIIGTDPDADRMAVMVRDGDDFRIITGNQMGELLLDYIITAKKSSGTMPENPGVLSSIVSTNMSAKICEVNNVHFEETFTGFKFMSQRAEEWRKAGTYNFIFAFEESIGYMMGDYVRDKDSVTASVIVAEMAAYYHTQGMTLLQALEALYKKYGYYAEKTFNLVMPGVDGIQRMQNIMSDLRQHPMKDIAGTDIVRIRDYKDGTITVPNLGRVDTTPISGSNVLYYDLADSCSFIIRPSGTEPKIKVYILVHGESQEKCNSLISRYSEFAQTIK